MICLSRYLEKLKGRDKVLRFVQYFSRFLTFQLMNSDPKSDIGGRLKLFHKAIGLHRKVWKIGTFIDEYLKFKEALNSKVDDTKKYLTLGLRACMMFYLVYDNLVWFVAVKAIEGNKDLLKLRSYYFRFIAALCNLALVAMSFQETTQKLETVKTDVKLEEKQGANVLGLVKNGCDILTFGNNTKWFPFLELDDGQMGLFGAISSMAGGVPIWFKL